MDPLQDAEGERVRSNDDFAMRVAETATPNPMTSRVHVHDFFLENGISGLYGLVYTTFKDYILSALITG
jgi:hypothetical protein